MTGRTMTPETALREAVLTRRVTVRYGRKHVTVTIVDTCACADRRVIDLSIGAFERLAPWGMGSSP